MRRHDYDNSYALDGVSGSCDPEEFKLEVGDIIDYGGMTGRVISVEDDCWHEWPVDVVFDEGYKMTLTRDGRAFQRQKYPVIKVIGHEVQKTKKWIWVVKDDETWRTTTLLSEDEANQMFRSMNKIKIDQSEIEV